MGALAIFGSILGWLSIVLSALGTLYMLGAAWIFRRFRASPPKTERRRDAITLLKPLHGAEPRLAENLASFLEQDHAGPIQLLCGVQRADDPAIAAVEALRLHYPDAVIDLVVDSTRHGASGKISNLINMAPHIANPVVVLSDSDMAVAPDYLACLLAALDQPGTGAVTCVYEGRGDAGFWSRLGAAGLSWQFLPSAVFGVTLGLARPCMGSTIAMRRETLESIGGFRRFTDVLADDYAIGEAIHEKGLRVIVSPMIVTHASAETSFAELWRHELRWGVTVRDIVPAAYAAGVIGMPLPLALIGAPFHPAAGAIALLAALLARVAVAGTVAGRAGHRPAPLWLLPLRDCLTFVVFVASLFTRSVDWRGARLRIGKNGRLAASTETSP